MFIVIIASVLVAFFKADTTIGTIAFMVAEAATLVSSRNLLMQEEGFLFPRHGKPDMIDAACVIIGGFFGGLAISVPYGAAIVTAILAASAYYAEVDDKLERGAFFHPAFLAFVFSIFPLVRGLKGFENLGERILKGPAVWNIAAMVLMIIVLVMSAVKERGGKK